MGNMSYCRFRNTEEDLEDCLDALSNREISSEEEKRSARRMLRKIINFLDQEGITEDIDVEKIISECEVSL